MAVEPSLPDVKSEVNTQLEHAQTRANSAANNTSNFLNALANSAYIGTPQIGDVSGGNVSISITQIPTGGPDRPTTALDTIKGKLSDLPEAAFTVTSLNPNFPTINEKNIPAPTVSLPDAPTFVTELSADKPVITTPTNATSPTGTVPSSPTGIGNYTIPSPPSIVIADFGSPLPPYTLSVPALAFNYVESEYTSALKDALTAKLLSDVQNGGTGLAENVEEAIWERTRERDNRDYEDAADKIDSRWSGKGFSLPDGVLVELHQDLIVDDRNQRIERSRDILIKQAELAQTNTHFALSTSLGLEQVELNHANEVNNRALAAEKAAVEFGISYYNLKIADYNIQLEKAKMQATEQASRLDAERLRLEAYRTELLESEAKSRLDKDLLSKYNLDLDRYQKLLELFKAEQGAVNTALGIEGIKIDFYRANIEDHRARIDAQSKEAELYKAQTEGELGKIRIYEAELSAERTRVETLKLQTESEIARLRQNVELQELELRAFLGNIERYKAIAGIGIAELSQEAIMYGHDIDRYRGELARDTASMQMGIETLIKGRALDLQNAGIRLENAKANLQAAVSTASIRVQAAKGIADAYADLAGAAMSGFSAIASIESGGLSHEYEDKTP